MHFNTMLYYLLNGITLLRKININVVIVFFPAKLSSSDPKLLRKLWSELYLDVQGQTLFSLDIATTLVDRTARVNCPLLHW